MKVIKIIPQLHIDAVGIRSKPLRGKLQPVHFRQGELDGACAVYSTIMILIILNKVRYRDIELFGKDHDGRTSIGRLKKELFDTKGMHRYGQYLAHDEFDSIADILRRSFAKHVAITLAEKKNVNPASICEAINEDLPVLISVIYQGGGAHAMVAIGYEMNEQELITKIFCLDPAYPAPKFTYWNSYIDLNSGTARFPHLQKTETGESILVQLDDILIISGK
jgi:hypothetical protein